MTTRDRMTGAQKTHRKSDKEPQRCLDEVFAGEHPLSAIEDIHHVEGLWSGQDPVARPVHDIGKGQVAMRRPQAWNEPVK